jgi:hypothetical protein
MDAGQFAAFVQAEQADRQAVRDATQQQDVARQAVQLDSVTRQKANQQILKVLKELSS